jgi:hypothetical protein
MELLKNKIAPSSIFHLGNPHMAVEERSSSIWKANINLSISSLIHSFNKYIFYSIPDIDTIRAHTNINPSCFQGT